MNNNSNKNSISPVLIEKMIAIQEQELLMKGKSLELQKQNDGNAHEYAKAALQANVQDRESSRKYQKDAFKHRYIFAGLVLCLLVILFCIALYLNKDQVVMEIIKAIIYFGSGGIGGYAFAKKDAWSKSE